MQRYGKYFIFPKLLGDNYWLIYVLLLILLFFYSLLLFERVDFRRYCLLQFLFGIALTSSKSFLPILILQLSRPLRDNLFSILSTLISKHFAINTFTNMPVHHRLGVVGCSCYLTTRLLDNLTQILYQRFCRRLRHNYRRRGFAGSRVRGCISKIGKEVGERKELLIYYILYIIL